MMHKSVEDYLDARPQWTKELGLLRSIMLECGLEETVKWGEPAYLHRGKNIIGLSGFKAYVSIWFHQGCFLRDELQKLVNAQKGKTKALRQWRFKDVSAVDRDLVKAYVLEAMDNQEKGMVMKPAKRSAKPLVIPDELKKAFASDLDLSHHFEQLTLSKKREYAEYIAEAKRAETKQRRLEKIIPMIRSGVGLNDHYK